MDDKEFNRLTSIIEAEAARIEREDPEGWAAAGRIADLLERHGLIDEYLKAAAAEITRCGYCGREVDPTTPRCEGCGFPERQTPP